jgi:cytochrome c553
MKKITLVVCWLISSYALADNIYSQAQALQPHLENGKQVYKMCAACHLTNGYGKKDGSFPVIANQHKSVIIKQLQDIQNKQRHNPTMFPFANPQTIGGTQHIADVAGYIESLPKITTHGRGTGDYLQRGKKLYTAYCVACHKKNGEGDSNLRYPKISNQHYEYILRQLRWMSSGYRKNSNPAMLTIIKEMNDKDFQALADYLSRL